MGRTRNPKVNPWPRPARRVLRRALPQETFERWVGRHERLSLAVWVTLATQLPPGATVLDIGAYEGEYALATRAIRSDLRIVAFEPNPLTLPVLESRCDGHDVEILAVAVGAAAGEASFRVSGASSGLDGGVDGEQGVTVSVARLDDLDLGPVGLMKIDTEGAEEAVIRGARTTLELWHPLILCEVLSDEAGQAVADALPSGYATFKIDENRGLIPVEGPRRWEWRNKNVLLVPTIPHAGGASAG